MIMMKVIMNTVCALFLRVSLLSYCDSNHDESDHEHCMCFISQGKSLVILR